MDINAVAMVAGAIFGTVFATLLALAFGPAVSAWVRRKISRLVGT